MTQDDWYQEAVAREENAERWFLSDIRRTLRSFSEAMDAYENALKASQQNIEDTYNIYYNQTRLLLKIYTDYFSVDGYINLLQFVNLDDIPSLDRLVVPIKTIIERFEFVTYNYPEQVTWDLLFNVLTCYSVYLESDADLTGEELITIASTFISTFHRLIRLENELMEDPFTEPEGLDEYKRDGLQDQTDFNLQTGSGVKTNESEKNLSETVISSDSVDRDTILETISMGYKFVYDIMTTILEDQSSAKGSMINFVQKNYINDILTKYLSQLDEILGNPMIRDENYADLRATISSIKGLKLLFNDQFEPFQNYIDSVSSDDEDTLMSTTDLLETALLIFPTQFHWQIRSYISKTLGKLQSLLAEKQSSIIIGKVKNRENELSPIVFKLCDLMINRSDNELARLMLKKEESASLQNEDAAKTIGLLQKNARALLTNVQSIAHRSCGFGEYVTDKLKRNYIYSQAVARLSFLDALTPTDIPDMVSDHPFYIALYNSRK